MMKESIYQFAPNELSGLAKELEFPAFRGKQLASELFSQRTRDFASMKTLPSAFREELNNKFLDLNGTAKRISVSGEAPGTRKLLLEMADGECIETVIIPARDRRITFCVSSQAGCAFSCAFCASGKRGVVRSLSTGEILSQVIRASIECEIERPSNIVFMGIGEPFANYDSVLKAIRIMNSPEGFGIGARHITVSTCGVVPGIRKLAKEGLQIELSVSLHAPTDEQRSKLMPVNRKWHLAELMSACREYTAETKRIITFEYTLVRHFNDRPSDAAELIKLLRGLGCRINLIPLSPVKEFDGETPPDETLYGFRDALLDAGINTTLRMSKGKSVDAACGQLRLNRNAETIADSQNQRR